MSAYPAIDEVQGYFASSRAALHALIESATDEDLRVSLAEASGGFATDLEDAFIRIWALRRSMSLTPRDAALRVALQSELAKLGMKF